MRIATVLSALVLLPVAASAQSGQAQLDRMYKFYAGAQSFGQTASNSTYRVLGPSRQMAGLQSELRFQRPNKVYIAITSPSLGSLLAGCDGTTMTIYSSKRNQFDRLPAPKDLKGILEVLARLGIGAEMDALFFLAFTPPANFVSNPTLKPNENVNGTPCSVVEGGYVSPLMMRGRKGVATLYMDAKTGALMKTKLSFLKMPVKVRAPVLKDGKQVVKDKKPVYMEKSLTMDIISSQVVNRIETAPKFDAASFAVKVPAGAVELKMRELLGKPK
jgi:hypothetical protein